MPYQGADGVPPRLHAKCLLFTAVSSGPGQACVAGHEGVKAIPSAPLLTSGDTSEAVRNHSLAWGPTFTKPSPGPEPLFSPAVRTTPANSSAAARSTSGSTLP